MDVAASELRAHLRDYLDRVCEGAEVVITDWGVPVARLLGLAATDTLERLTSEGVIARSTAPLPRASGQPRPQPANRSRTSPATSGASHGADLLDSSAPQA
jgi:prevent-host-death family protein